MRIASTVGRILCGLLVAVSAVAAGAAEFPPPKQGSWVARDFKFHTGETMPELRLHYRTLNQLEQFKTVEKAPGEDFVIPGSDISGGYDLMYYFEVLNDANGGWFQLDPLVQTPYYVVQTSAKK